MKEKLNILTQQNSNRFSLELIDQRLKDIELEVKEIRNFVEEIEETSQKTRTQYISLLHALDHID